MTIPQANLRPFPWTKSLTISPSSLATTSDRYVRSIRNTAWLTSRPASLLDQRGIMMLIKLKNWWRKARFKPGLVCAAGTVPSASPDTLGGFRKRRRWASKVRGFVVWMTTLDVWFL